jgi:hypothetical protein
VGPIISQGTPVVDASCPGADHTCDPARAALALLARVATPIPLSRRLQLVASASAGYGQVRHVVPVADLADCGASHTEACMDTVAAGPVLLGAALALVVDVGGPFAVRGSLGALVAVPHPAIDGELGLGLVVKF